MKNQTVKSNLQMCVVDQPNHSTELICNYFRFVGLELDQTMYGRISKLDNYQAFETNGNRTESAIWDCIL